MKKQLNRKKYQKEVDIFREMARILNSSYNINSLFVKETHGQKGLVSFWSKYRPKPKPITREIADLLFVVHNTHTNELRICFLQAKYQKNRFPFPGFTGDIYQWDLLRYRYSIISKTNKFPSNILSFTSYKTITTYGIFFIDFMNQLDMLYTIPEFLNPLKRKKTLYFLPCCKNIYNTHNEHTRSCTINCFIHHLIQGRIGAPILSAPSIVAWLRSLLLYAKNNSSSEDTKPKLLSNLIELCNKTTASSETIDGLPFSLFLIETGDKTL